MGPRPRGVRLVGCGKFVAQALTEIPNGGTPVGTMVV